MIRRSVALLALGGAALLAFGMWMGRSASEPVRIDAESSTATPVIAPPAASPAAGRARVPAQPALPRRSASSSSTLPGLAADLISADPKVRRAAVAEVASSADADPQILLNASRDPDPSIAATSITALGKLYADGRVATTDMLARARDRSHGPRVHTMALNAVGAVPHPDTARMLGELLATGTVGERRAASALLASQDPADAIPLLIRALSDSDEYVRDNAINGLRSRSRGRDFGTDAGAWQSWWQAQRR
jgi:hypothetical protein